MALLQFMLPDLPCYQSGAEIVRWLCQPNDVLLADTPLVIVLTDRVEVVVPAGVAGRLDTILCAEKAKVAFDQPLAQITTVLAPVQARPTPLARRFAAAHAINLASVTPSGPHGRIWLRDVAAFVADASHQSPVTSHQSPIAHGPLPIASLPYILTARECDLDMTLTRCESEREAFAWRGVALDHVAIITLAALEVLPHHKDLLGRWSDDGIIQRRRLHLGVGDATGNLMRVIADASDLTLRGLARALSRVPAHTDQPDATFVIAPLGAGAWWSDVRRLPLHGVATLGIGAPQPKPVVINDTLQVRSVSLLSLVFDARIITQFHADRFLTALCAKLENDT